ncbi:MAG: hypothetical protein AAFZ52_05010 [Bacteroidota bacterium]
MSADLQYMTDAEGQRMAVIVPIAEWERISLLLRKSDALFQISQGVKEAMQEVREMKEGKKEETTLAEFLDEL